MMQNTHDNINGYITNLGKYNEGFLIGEWIEFPIDEEDLEEVLLRIGVSSEPDENGRYYEEYFFTDWEIPVEGLELGEYVNVKEVNSIAEEIERLSDYEFELLNSIIDGTGYDFSCALDYIDNGNYIVFSGCDSMSDVARQGLEESGLLSNIDSWIVNYIDFESMGEDLDEEGTYIEATLNNTNCMVELLD